MSDVLSPADRAILLDWLANVFSREPDADTVARIRGPEGAQLLAVLADIPGIGADARALGAAVRALYAAQGSDSDTALALAGRFGTLFLGAAGPDGAHPYASIYQEGRTHGAATDRAKTFLAEHGMAVRPDFPEPEDHLGVLLYALGALSIRESEAAAAEAAALFAAQQDFVRTEMLPWLPDFRTRVERDDPDGYFGAAARLTENALSVLYAGEGRR
jgi:TorA-specific chaperone